MNPLKQGLKRQMILTDINCAISVKEVNPLKQGLKPVGAQFVPFNNHFVKEVNPLKQGLKLTIGNEYSTNYSRC